VRNKLNLNLNSDVNKDVSRKDLDKERTSITEKSYFALVAAS